MCDGITVIESGKLLASGTVGEIQKRLQPHLSIYLRALGPIDEAHKALLEEAHVSNVHAAREGLAFDFAGDDDAMAELLARLVARGVRPVEFAGEAVRLEDVFMSLTEGKLQ
jgi:ABC-2 type transport system ATP-binding protein